MIHVWVGTDRFQQQSGAERVLEYSIHKHASEPVTVHYMRSGDPGFAISVDGGNGTWRAGQDGTKAWSGTGWATPFSLFRMAIPELAGFEGVHVYLDADMLLLGDIAELVRLPRKAPWLCQSHKRTDVSVIDAAAFKGLPWWPPIEWMKSSGATLWRYRQWMIEHRFIDDSLPWYWNWTDDRKRPLEIGPDRARLLHFTTVPTQPWRPYPDVKYQPNPNEEWVDLWRQYEQEALTVRA